MVSQNNKLYRDLMPITWYDKTCQIKNWYLSGSVIYRVDPPPPMGIWVSIQACGRPGWWSSLRGYSRECSAWSPIPYQSPGGAYPTPSLAILQGGAWWAIISGQPLPCVSNCANLVPSKRGCWRQWSLGRYQGTGMVSLQLPLCFCAYSSLPFSTAFSWRVGLVPICSESRRIL